MRLSVVLIFVCLLTLISSRLEASPVIFTDRAVFEAVVQPNVLVTFDKVVSVDDPSVRASCANGLCHALVDDILRTSASDFDGLPRDGELPVFVDLTILTLEGGARFAAIGFDISSDVMFFWSVGADGVFEPFHT